jgi:hypothetical protein
MANPCDGAVGELVGRFAFVVLLLAADLTSAAVAPP